jgi:hypothetical protein
MATAYRLLTTASVCLLLLCFGCEEEDKKKDTKPIVGVLELPLSKRHKDDPPNNARKIAISPKELRVEGEKVVALRGGKLDDGDVKGRTVPKLASAMEGRSGAAVRMHVNTPYGTMTRVLDTLAEADVDAVAFQVRKGSGAETGWLTLTDYRVEPPSDEPFEFEGEVQRKWDAFGEKWKHFYEACRGSHYVACDAPAARVAEGGNLQLELFARGSAVRFNLRRFGGPDPEEQDSSGGGGGGGVAMIDGVAPAQPAGSGKKEKKVPPATEATFTWHFDVATKKDSSSIGKALRPICGAKPCGAEVVAESGTPSMRLMSLIGAAFPDGAPTPHLVFRLPKR